MGGSLHDIVAEFSRRFKGKPDFISAAPGRVNLIGEHTDYNDGFVLPMAIDRSVRVAVSGREDRVASIYSANFDESVSFEIDSLGEREGSIRWHDYVKGVALEFLKLGFDIRGFNGLIWGDVPIGAGLSSSAAIEVATAHSLSLLNSVELEPTELAKLCRRAENLYVGVNCGIMDQFVSALGLREHALFLDCRDLSYSHVPLPRDEVSVVVCDSKVRRELAGSEYNIRRAQCAEGVKLLSEFLPGISSLRDVSYSDFLRYSESLPGDVRRRCRHVITENERTREAAELLRAGEFHRFGELMNLSHESLRDDYEVSCMELDALVEAARASEGLLGARLTGAGFGGCTVNLVEPSLVESFCSSVSSRYEAETGIRPDIYVFSAQDGVRSLPQDSESR